MGGSHKIFLSRWQSLEQFVWTLTPCLSDARAYEFQSWPHTSRFMQSPVSWTLCPQTLGPISKSHSKPFRNGENTLKSFNGQYKISSYQNLITTKTLYFPASTATCIITTTTKRWQVKYYQPWNNIMYEIPNVSKFI